MTKKYEAPKLSITTEPKITINGHDLSYAQSMTVRVGLDNFSVFLCEDGLGDTSHGKTMVNLYMDRIEEIRKLMHINQKGGK